MALKDPSSGGAGARFALSAILLAGLGVRLLVLCFPSGQVFPRWVYRDELHTGNVAAEVLAGPLLALQDLRHSPSSGGGLTLSLLAAPAVAAFGDRIAAVRIVPLLFSLAAVFLLFRFLDRLVGRRAACFGGLLAACAPPGFVAVSTTAWGAHACSLPFALGCLLLTCTGPETGRPGAARAFLGGLLAGYGLYFVYTTAVALAAVAALLALERPRFFRSARIAAFGAGFLVGLAPWIHHNLVDGFEGLSIYGRSPGDMLRSLPATLQRLGQLVTDWMPDALYFRGFPRAEIALDRALWLVLFALAAAGLLRWRGRQRGQRTAARAAGLHLALFAVAVALVEPASYAGDPSTRPRSAQAARYLMPMFPYLWMAAALGLERLASRGRGARTAAWGVVGAVCALCVAGTVAVSAGLRPRPDLATRATDPRELGDFLAIRYAADVERLGRLVERLEGRPERFQHIILFAFAVHYRRMLEAPRAKELPPERRAALRAARAFFYDRVGEPFRPYFERPFPGQRGYSTRGRGNFWRDYRAYRERGPPLPPER